MIKNQRPKPLLTPAEEKDLILNLLDGDQDEVSLLSRRLLQMHYMNLAENKERFR